MKIELSNMAASFPGGAALTNLVDSIWRSVAERAPSVLAAGGLLLALWLVALLVRGVLRRLLGATRIDDSLGATRLGSILHGLSEGLTPSRAVASLAYWAILLLALSAASGILGLTAVERVIAAVLGYLPRIGSAFLVLAIGGWVAGAAKRAAGTVLREMKSPFAGLAETVTETALLLLSVALAVDTLGLDLSFLSSNLAVLVGALVLTIAFLACWAMRAPAENIIANYYLRRLVSVGDAVELGAVAGTLKKFAPLGIVLRDSRGDDVFVPARHVLDGLRKTGTGLDLRVPPRAP